MLERFYFFLSGKIRVSCSNIFFWRSGRPTDVSTQEKVEKNNDIMLNDPEVITEMSYGSVINIIQNVMDIKKPFERWVPRFLTMDQKRIRVTAF